MGTAETERRRILAATSISYGVVNPRHVDCERGAGTPVGGIFSADREPAVGRERVHRQSRGAAADGRSPRGSLRSAQCLSGGPWPVHAVSEDQGTGVGGSAGGRGANPSLGLPSKSSVYSSLFHRWKTSDENRPTPLIQADEKIYENSYERFVMPLKEPPL